MPTLGHALLDALAAHGVREIFGIPGDFVLPFCKLIEESGTESRVSAGIGRSCPTRTVEPPTLA